MARRGYLKGGWPVSSVPSGSTAETGVVADLREEWEALGDVSYTGWQADLGKNDIANIRTLLNAAAGRVSALEAALRFYADASGEDFGGDQGRVASAALDLDSVSSRGVRGPAGDTGRAR